MIKLYSRHSLPQPETGKQLPFDLEKLRQDLESAFQTSGIKETWMADHILLTLCEESNIHVPPADDAEGIENQNSIDYIISRMLVDAGYPDVAHTFAKQRQLPIPDAAADALPWSPERIENVLRAKLTLSENARQRLVPHIVKKLELLGFRQVADNLICELGEHILSAYAQAERQKHDSSTGWLVGPSYWETCLSAEAAHFIETGVLAIRPGSDLFPSPRATLNLARLAHTVANECLTELAFFPKAQQACKNAAEAIQQLLQEAATTQTAPPPAHLAVTGVTEAVDNFVTASSKVRRKRLREELQTAIRAILQDYHAQRCRGQHELVKLSGDEVDREIEPRGRA
ncbi:MAG: hypothetical protein R6V56_07705, partial [Lentisphaeria bacterium]